MKRGAVVVAAARGAYSGKPRPVVVMQHDDFLKHTSVTILPITSELHNVPVARVTVAPSVKNGLHKASQIMIDKAQTIPRENIGATLGHLDSATLREVERALALWLGFRG